NNQYLQEGRTLARLGDEMAYMSQWMQKTADSAIDEGSSYRLATMQIPQAAGATTDSYGHIYASMQQGNQQQENGGPLASMARVGMGPGGPGGVMAWLQSVWQNIMPGDSMNLANQAQQELQPTTPTPPPQMSNLARVGMGPGGPGGVMAWLQSVWQNMIPGSSMNLVRQAQQELQQPPKPTSSSVATTGAALATPTASSSAGGNNGTQGFFDFTNLSDPNTIGTLQKQTLSMYSDTQIAQALQQYFASTNSAFSSSGVNATKDILALSSMSGISADQLTSQLGSITGMSQPGGNQPAQLQQVVGMMNKLFQGNLSEQNISPYLNAMESVVGNMAGVNPASGMSPTSQAGAIFQMATNAGYNPNNLSTVADMTNSLSSIGYSPNLQGQYALSQLYGAQNMT